MEKEKWVEARDCYEKVLLIKPGHSEAVKNIKIVYVELRKIAINKRKSEIKKRSYGGLDSLGWEYFEKYLPIYSSTSRL